MKKRLVVLFALLLALVGCSPALTHGGEASDDGGITTSQTTDATGSSSTGGKAADSSSTTDKAAGSTSSSSAQAARKAIAEDGTYTSKDEVALYLHTYGHLPSNFVTKEEAEDAGWKTEGLTIDEACPGKSLGDNHFGNYEKKLPTARGRTWRECDIDYHGGRSRGAKRLVYSSDGLIYYTEDHYETFEQLY